MRDIYPFLRVRARIRIKYDDGTGEKVYVTTITPLADSATCPHEIWSVERDEGKIIAYECPECGKIEAVT